MFKKFIKDLTLATKVILILCVVSMIINLAAYGKITWDNIKMNLFYNLYYGYPLTFVNGWFLDFLDKFASWEKSPKTRLWLGIIGSIVVTMTTLIGLNYLLWIVIWGKDPSILFGRSNLDFYIIALMITIIISSLLHAIGFYKEVQQEKQVSERLRREKLTSELNALKAHVDPHFLFNSFNVLSGLIEEDKEKAQDFLSGLSKIYRYILESRNEDTSTLEEELNFANAYLDLHLARFEDSIYLNVDIPTDLLSKSVPSLTLQLLLENAIKHNAFDSEDPLKIDIYKEGESIVVKNNKKKRAILSEGNGMGLSNIRDRYSLLSKEKVSLLETNDYFIVKIPILDR